MCRWHNGCYGGWCLRISFHFFFGADICKWYQRSYIQFDTMWWPFGKWDGKMSFPPDLFILSSLTTIFIHYNDECRKWHMRDTYTKISSLWNLSWLGNSHQSRRNIWVIKFNYFKVISSIRTQISERMCMMIISVAVTTSLKRIRYMKLNGDEKCQFSAEFDNKKN
jgi:hypothetical protein